MARKHKSTWWNRHQLFVIQQQLLCVCLPFSIVSLILCCLSLTSTQIKLLDGYKCNKTRTWARADCITGCAFLLANVYLYWGYTQSVCCLLESRALRISSRGRLLGHFFTECICSRRLSQAE